MVVVVLSPLLSSSFGCCCFSWPLRFFCFCLSPCCLRCLCSLVSSIFDASSLWLFCLLLLLLFFSPRISQSIHTRTHADSLRLSSHSPSLLQYKIARGAEGSGGERWTSISSKGVSRRKVTGEIAANACTCFKHCRHHHPFLIPQGASWKAQTNPTRKIRVAPSHARWVTCLCNLLRGSSAFARVRERSDM